MKRREYFSKMKNLCKQMNALIPIKEIEDVNKLNDLINEARSEVPGFNLYWDRELFIDCNGDDDRIRGVTLHSGKVQFEPNEDPVEHPGVVIRYIDKKDEI